jgi:hypothetical protein
MKLKEIKEACPVELNYHPAKGKSPCEETLAFVRQHFDARKWESIKLWEPNRITFYARKSRITLGYDSMEVTFGGDDYIVVRNTKLSRLSQENSTKYYWIIK